MSHVILKQVARISNGLLAQIDEHGNEYNLGYNDECYRVIRWALAATEAAMAGRLGDTARFISRCWSSIKERNSAGPLLNKAELEWEPDGIGSRDECVRFAVSLPSRSDPSHLIVRQGEIFTERTLKRLGLYDWLNAEYPDGEWHNFAIWGTWTEGV